jgi:phosphate:Na+ symporter
MLHCADPAGCFGEIPLQTDETFRVNPTLEAVLPMAMAVVGGLGIFMLGMKYMSEGMQAVAGNSLRRMISMVTNNRVMATGAGTAVTVLVQSSTITTVIVVGLVNAGLMQLHQSIGVILGANIGTTITGWILVLKVGQYGLPLLGVAALAYLFSRRDRPKFIAMALMGSGWSSSAWS